MADPLTSNIQLAVPIRGTDVGTWDVPVNGDFTILDSAFGGVQSFSNTSGNVNLTVTQAQNAIIRVSATLVGNLTLTLPAIFKFWTIDNQITNSPSTGFFVSVIGGNTLGIPPGVTDIFYDGTTTNYRNLGKVGEYWDFAGSQVPNWVTGTTKPPYLLCNGGSFSGATYPQLNSLLGGTTLPDARGRARYALDAGTNRVTVGVSGINGNTLIAAGGDQSLQSHTHANSLNDPGHVHSYSLTNYSAAYAGGIFPAGNNESLANTNANFTGMTITNAAAGSGAAQNMPPALVHGVTMIRAA